MALPTRQNSITQATLARATIPLCPVRRSDGCSTLGAAPKAALSFRRTPMTWTTIPFGATLHQFCVDGRHAFYLQGSRDMVDRVLLALMARQDPQKQKASSK
jgi:hypothetical protein